MSVARRIRSKDLETGSVNARVLGFDAVTGRAIAPGAVGRGQIVGGAIGSDELEAHGVTAPKVGDGAIEARAIANGAIEVAKFAQSIRPVQLVDVLPALPDEEYPSGSFAYLKSDGKLYRNVDGVWTAKVATVDLDGVIEELQIADAAISAAKLSDNAVVARTVAAGAIVTDALAANAVTAGKVAALAIETGHLAANSVAAGKIAVDAVTAGTIAAGAVSTDELAANAVTAGKIKADAVGATQLAAIYLEVGKYIRSSNYLAGSDGWAIDAAGNVEFNSATIRNGLYTGGTITAATFQTATSGARVRIVSGSDGVTFYNSGTASSTLRLGNADGLEVSGSFRVGGALADRTLYAGAVIIAGGDGAGGATIDTTGEVRGTDLRASGDVLAAGHAETANAANCVILTSGRLLRSTSVRESKTDIAALTEPEWRIALALQPVSFRSALPDDDPERRHLGLVAEDVAAVDPSLALIGEDGQIHGVAYDRISVPLLGLAHEHHSRLALIEDRLAVLEGVL